jgi:hypothetical protein
MADRRLLSDLFARYRGPMGSIEDRRGVDFDERGEAVAEQEYLASPEYRRARWLWKTNPVQPMGRASFDAGFWDIDRLAGPSGLAALAERYGRPGK